MIYENMKWGYDCVCNKMVDVVVFIVCDGICVVGVVIWYVFWYVDSECFCVGYCGCNDIDSYSVYVVFFVFGGVDVFGVGCVCVWLECLIVLCLGYGVSDFVCVGYFIRCCVYYDKNVFCCG